MLYFPIQLMRHAAVKTSDDDLCSALVSRPLQVDFSGVSLSRPAEFSNDLTVAVFTFPSKDNVPRCQLTTCPISCAVGKKK